jgi:hypothetical protein
MMFLAHFSASGISEVEEMPAEKIYYWYNEAEKLHNKLNPSE